MRGLAPLRKIQMYAEKEHRKIRKKIEKHKQKRAAARLDIWRIRYKK